MKYILILLASLFILSCEKEVTIDQKKYPPKIVLNCIINSSSDTILVKLSESRDMLYDKTTYPIVENATVNLYDNEILVGQLNELGGGYYRIFHTITPLHTYTLKVTNTKFEDVSATTSVPSPTPINSFTASLDQNKKADINLSFNDPANEDNYYNISVSRLDTLIDTINNQYFGDPYYSPYFCTESAVIEYPVSDGLSAKLCNTNFLFSDKTFKNSAYNFNCEFETTLYQTPDNTPVYTEISVNFKTYSRDYYQYQLSTSIARDNFGNPFAEPVKIYNNITNGFGIFGSYSTYIDTLKL